MPPRRGGRGGTSTHVVGLPQLQAVIRSLGVTLQREETWAVATVVRYAPFHEFGTFKMAARPYFRPGAFRVSAKVTEKLVESARRKTPPKIINGKQLWEVWFAPEKAVAAKVAAMLEREIKKVMTEKHIIDTGNLRASIVAAPLDKVGEASASRSSPNPRGTKIVKF